jgi:hypothetical protein
MKKSNYYLLIAGALGVTLVTAFSTKLAVGQSCCSAPTDAVTATTVSDGAVKPDLLTTCPVSGEKLGEMGKAFVFTNNLQEVKLCCPGCKKDFDKNPDKYLAKIRAADKK